MNNSLNFFKYKKLNTKDCSIWHKSKVLHKTKATEFLTAINGFFWYKILENILIMFIMLLVTKSKQNWSVIYSTIIILISLRNGIWSLTAQKLTSKETSKNDSERKNRPIFVTKRVIKSSLLRERWASKNPVTSVLLVLWIHVFDAICKIVFGSF